MGLMDKLRLHEALACHCRQCSGANCRCGCTMPAKQRVCSCGVHCGCPRCVCEAQGASMAMGGNTRGY
jgi:hypothetical protein